MFFLLQLFFLYWLIGVFVTLYKSAKPATFNIPEWQSFTGKKKWIRFATIALFWPFHKRNDP